MGPRIFRKLSGNYPEAFRKRNVPRGPRGPRGCPRMPRVDVFFALPHVWDEAQFPLFSLLLLLILQKPIFTQCVDIKFTVVFTDTLNRKLIFTDCQNLKFTVVFTTFLTHSFSMFIGFYCVVVNVSFVLFCFTDIFNNKHDYLVFLLSRKLQEAIRNNYVS